MLTDDRTPSPDPLAQMLRVGPAPFTAPARQDRLRIRVFEHEITRWRAAAESAGAASVSGWLRNLAEEAAATGRDPTAWRTSILETQRDLSGMANNLNQMAKHLNALRKAGKIADPESAAVSLATMSADLENSLHNLENLLSPNQPKSRRGNRPKKLDKGSAPA